VPGRGSGHRAGELIEQGHAPDRPAQGLAGLLLGLGKQPELPVRHGHPGPVVEFFLDGEGLAVPVLGLGGPVVMRRQCQHLLRMNQRSNIVIQVRNADGLACAFGRAFMLLSFKHQGDLVYIEDIASARYIRDRDEVARYSLAFDHLRGAPWQMTSPRH